MPLEFIGTIALLVVAYSLISGRLDRTPITPPLFFMLAGMALCPESMGVFSLERDGEAFRLLAELTLVLVLFSDAARMNLRLLWKEHNLPLRMLLVGLPLTLILGTLLASWTLGFLSLLEAALVAAVLTPTDAALGQAVVSNQKVPIRIRQTINVESGLNDGIALPAVVILVSYLGSGSSADSSHWIAFALKQIGFGSAVGIGVGMVGGGLLDRADRAGWVNGTFRGLAALGLAFSAYFLAEAVHGNGFIAAFLGGLIFGHMVRHNCAKLYEFAEGEGQFMTLLVFLFFGALLLPPILPLVDWQIIVFSLLALTLMRMGPVILSLLGQGLRWDTLLFLSWFGPRGIASILFTLLVVAESELAGSRLLTIAFFTVFLSVILHGLTAYPASIWYARRLAAARSAAEMDEVAAMPGLSATRHRS